MRDDRARSRAPIKARASFGAVATPGGSSCRASMTFALSLVLACSGAKEQTSGGPNASGNLIANGDFAEGDRFWEVDSFSPWWKRPFESVSNRGKDGRLCATVANGSGAAVGWPREAHPDEGFSLAAGASYRFSFVMTATVARWITAEAKIGMVTAPYEPVLDEELVLTAGHRTFEYEFAMTRAAEAAGVVFIIKAFGGAPETVACFDDVKLEAAPAAMTLAP
jgi:hypothetical protein